MQLIQDELEELEEYGITKENAATLTYDDIEPYMETKPRVGGGHSYLVRGMYALQVCM